MAQRNAKLAEALGLSPAEQQSRSHPREYPATALSYYASNRRFAEDLERSYTDFIRSYRHAMLLTPTSPAQRNFMHDLASVFRLQTEDVDDEPRRAVAVRRTQFAQAPEPSLTEAYRQHQEVVARNRPTALNPMRRTQTPTTPTTPGGSGSGSGTSTPLLSQSLHPATSVENQMNALMLRGVFGVDEATLKDTLRRLPGMGSVPIHVRWLDDDDVVVVISNATTAKLQTLKNEVRNAQLLNGGYSRLARDVLVCLANEHGKVLRFETAREAAAAGGSGGTAPAVGVARHSPAFTSAAHPRASQAVRAGASGWAAVAASGGNGAAGGSGGSAARAMPPSAWSVPR